MIGNIPIQRHKNKSIEISEAFYTISRKLFKKIVKESHLFFFGTLLQIEHSILQ